MIGRARRAPSRMLRYRNDRDIIVEVLAQGEDPSSTQAGELGGEEVVTIAPTTPLTRR